MSIHDAISALSPAAHVYVDDGEVVSQPGTVDTVKNVTPVSGLDGEAMRFSKGRVTVKNVANFSSDRNMTIVAWVRCLSEMSARRVVGRENGSTLVGVQLTAGGQPRLELRSTVGNYVLSLTGSRRVDDGEWHLITAVVKKKYNALGLDTRGVDTFMWIDGQLSTQGYFTPGIFGVTPNYGMSTDVIVGQTAGGSLSFTGDIAAAAVSSTAASDAAIKAMWDGKPEIEAGSTGWGIVLS